jgi:hypothetical protein
MSQSQSTRPPAGPLVHDPLVCGLGEEYCPGCASEPPDPTVPPWGESLVREYRQTLGDWHDLDLQDRPGIPRDHRDRLAADKLRSFDRAAAFRARAVNELLAILRWASEDTTGHLAELLRDPVQSIIEPDLAALAEALLRPRGGG